MSKELANRMAEEGMDLSPSDEALELRDELVNSAPDSLIENPKERMDAALNHEFVPAKVNSWEDLWAHYAPN